MSENDVRELEDAYWKHLLMKGERPMSVYAFMDSLGREEADFYQSYTSLDNLEASYWLATVDGTIRVLEEDEDYADYPADQKLLAFFFTYITYIQGARSRFVEYFPKLHLKHGVMMPSSLKGMGRRFRAYAEGIVSEGVEQGVFADRKKLLEQWQQLKLLPHHNMQNKAQEMVSHYKSLIKEDSNWVEPLPEKLKTMDDEQKIRYWLYRLRDLDMGQHSDPGACYVLNEIFWEVSEVNPALELKKMGETAIPYLIEHLSDSRPTRCKGHWRSYWPEGHYLLRYQDAAIQILNEILPARFYGRVDAEYFSQESSAVQKEVIDAITEWYQVSRNVSELDKRWLAVPLIPDLYSKLGLLDSLSSNKVPNLRVQFELYQLCKDCDPLVLPQISYSLCNCGDTSQLDQVISAYCLKKYRDDPNAEDYALRQIVLYGNADQLKKMKVYFGLGDNTSLASQWEVFRHLVDYGSGTFRHFPKKYDKSQFPLDLLIDSLEMKSEWATSHTGTEKWVIRKCDEAAETIQLFSEKDFGFKARATVEEKDRIIAEIQQWFKDSQNKQ